MARDGRHCLAAAFDEPFFISLTQALGIDDNAVTARTPPPATTQVDWVRVCAASC